MIEEANPCSPHSSSAPVPRTEVRTDIPVSAKARQTEMHPEQEHVHFRSQGSLSPYGNRRCGFQSAARVLAWLYNVLARGCEQVAVAACGVPARSLRCLLISIILIGASFHWCSRVVGPAGFDAPMPSAKVTTRNGLATVAIVRMTCLDPTSMIETELSKLFGTRSSLPSPVSA